MDAADSRSLFQRKAQDRADLVLVHAPRDHRDKHDAQACRGAGFDAALFLRKQRPAAKCYVNRIVEPVKLQEQGVEPRLPERFGISRLRGKAQSVGVELEEGEAFFPPHADDLGQIVPHGRLAAGELDVEGAAVGHQVFVLLFDLFETEIRFRRFPRGGKADRAAQIAAPCYFQQHAAALAQMLGAEAAVLGAALFRHPPLARGIDGGILAVPAEIRGQVALPDQSGKSAVLITALVEINAVLFRALLRVDDAQADRADALGFSDDHNSPRSDRISMHFS